MAGALTPVAVPSVTFEAARDLARAREQVRADLMRCRHRLSKLLLRHGRVYDRKAWTQAHGRWLAAQSFEQVNTELLGHHPGWRPRARVAIFAPGVVEQSVVRRPPPVRRSPRGT